MSCASFRAHRWILIAIISFLATHVNPKTQYLISDDGIFVLCCGGNHMPIGERRYMCVNRLKDGSKAKQRKIRIIITNVDHTHIYIALESVMSRFFLGSCGILQLPSIIREKSKRKYMAKSVHRNPCHHMCSARSTFHFIWFALNPSRRSCPSQPPFDAIAICKMK